MICRRSFAIAFCFILACMVFLPAARGSEWNQMMKMQFNEPIEIPGMVLPAGAYWFVLLDSQSEQQTVRILSSDPSKIYATVLTVATQRTQPTDCTEIKLAERLHSQPEAVLDWYYPGLWSRSTSGLTCQYFSGGIVPSLEPQALSPSVPPATEPEVVSETLVLLQFDRRVREPRSGSLAHIV